MPRRSQERVNGVQPEQASQLCNIFVQRSISNRHSAQTPRALIRLFDVQMYNSIVIPVLSERRREKYIYIICVYSSRQIEMMFKHKAFKGMYNNYVSKEYLRFLNSCIAKTSLSLSSCDSI